MFNWEGIVEGGEFSSASKFSDRKEKKTPEEGLSTKEQNKNEEESGSTQEKLPPHTVKGVFQETEKGEIELRIPGGSFTKEEFEKHFPGAKVGEEVILTPFTLKEIINELLKISSDEKEK